MSLQTDGQLLKFFAEWKLINVSIVLELITINYSIFTISYLAMNLFEVLSILLLLEIQLALRAINTEIKAMLATNAVGNFLYIAYLIYGSNNSK